ncbi:hypothetical protein Tcan_12463, partial [Toxocara canis]
EDRPPTNAIAENGETVQKAATPHSFIPTVNPNEISKRSSLRLGALPDPAQLRVVPTASLDDLKERIYGKRTPASTQGGISPSVGVGGTFTRKFSSASRTPPSIETNDIRVSTKVAPPRTPPPPPPPPPPPRKTVTLEAREDRLPLEERMRLVLGCGADVEINRKPFNETAPPPPPPPPILVPDPVTSRRGRPPIPMLPVSTPGSVVSSRGRTPPPSRAAATISSSSTTRTRRYSFFFLIAVKFLRHRALDTFFSHSDA